MKKFILFGYLFSTCLLAITQQDCPSFDNRSNFPPIRDQDSHGICWAFAGAALLEEELCKSNKALCQVPLSVIDGHRCWWSEESGMGTFDEGSTGVFPYLDCSLRQGVCEEKYAPFIEPNGIFSDDQKTYTEKVKIAYEKVQRLKRQMQYPNVMSCASCSKNSTDVISEMQSIATELRASLKKRKRGVDRNYFDILFMSETVYDAMKNIFIPPQCIKKRLKFSPQLKVQRKSFDFNQVQKKLKYLQLAVKELRSVALSICSRRVMSGSYDDLTFMEKWFMSKQEFYQGVAKKSCGPHAVVAIASRWKDNQCQLFIRNSWGKGSAVSGWQPAEAVLYHTSKIEFLKGNK